MMEFNNNDQNPMNRSKMYRQYCNKGNGDDDSDDNDESDDDDASDDDDNDNTISRTCGPDE